MDLENRFLHVRQDNVQPRWHIHGIQSNDNRLQICVDQMRMHQNLLDDKKRLWLDHLFR